MPNGSDKALLPAGLTDVLPPNADYEAEVQQRIMSVFAHYGYERVKPPLLEFEENLLSGSGAAMASQTFRLMDPVSQRMMGLRADMTLQVARIAATRLYKSTRPLRLSYTGQVLRVKGTQLRPERQFGQVGAELIGVLSPAADAEVILMAVEALKAIGVRDLSVDLCMPTLVPAVCRDRKIPEQALRRLRTALDRKDAAGIASLEPDIGKASVKILSGLLTAAGVAGDSLRALKKLRLPKFAAEEESRLAATIKAIKQIAPDLTLTVDPVENRGFEYHTGVTFTLFAKGVRGELGSGGRYRAGNGTPRGEAATGLTLFMDTVLRAIAPPFVSPRVFLPFGTPAGVAAALRADGWITLAELKRSAKPEIEARAMRCTHILKGTKPVKLADKKFGGAKIKTSNKRKK
ncbi:MAG: ATP phosphoribosyltransferase regulatory subunit [Rhodospirillales bacterium]